MTGSADWPGRRALVLGAAGFIGRWVARQLSASGATVISAVRDPAGYAPVRRAWGISGEVVQFDALAEEGERLLLDIRPDVVFNLLGYGVDRSERDDDLMQELNAALPVRLAALATGGRRLVHIGSALEYGLLEGDAIETATCEPHTAYGRTKLAGTRAVLDATRHGANAIVARLFTVFGAGEHAGRLLPTLTAAARTSDTVRLSGGTQRRDFAYVEDVAAGLLRLATPSSADPLVNLATGCLTTVRDFAVTAAGVLGIDMDRLDFGAEAVRPDEMRLTSVSVDRLRSALDWTPDGNLGRTLPRAAAVGVRLAPGP